MLYINSVYDSWDQHDLLLFQLRYTDILFTEQEVSGLV